MLFPSQPPYIRQISLVAIRQILELQVLLDLLLQRLQGHHGLGQRGPEAWDQQQFLGLKPRLHRKSEPFLLQEHRGRRAPRVFQQRQQGPRLCLPPMWQTRVQQKFRGRVKADLGIERILKTMKTYFVYLRRYACHSRRRYKSGILFTPGTNVKSNILRVWPWNAFFLMVRAHVSSHYTD